MCFEPFEAWSKSIFFFQQVIQISVSGVEKMSEKTCWALWGCHLDINSEKLRDIHSDSLLNIFPTLTKTFNCYTLEGSPVHGKQKYIETFLSAVTKVEKSSIHMRLHSSVILNIPLQSLAYTFLFILSLCAVCQLCQMSGGERNIVDSKPRNRTWNLRLCARPAEGIGIHPLNESSWDGAWTCESCSSSLIIDM